MSDVIKISPLTFYTVMIGSDGHYWPGKVSTAHRAFVKLAQSLKPNLVLFNGDAVDCASISKYPPKGWEKKPSVEKELSIVQNRLNEIKLAATRYAPDVPVRFIWAQGNHDERFNDYLAKKAPEFKGVPGTSLKDFFPDWEMCVRVEVGGKNGAIIKHEFKGGANPLKSNLAAAGRTIVTGHHHCQNVLAHTDCNGTRWGVDAGMLAAVDGPQFSYNEGNPVNWRSGFAILRWFQGSLVPPSLVTVLDEKKGKVHYDGTTFCV